MCGYTAEGVDFTFTPGSIDILWYMAVDIYEESYRQSERDVPD